LKAPNFLLTGNRRFLFVPFLFHSTLPMSTTFTYPPSPADIPEGLTRMASSYRTRAWLAVGAIILFFLLYFALVAALGFLVYIAIFYPIEHINKLTIFMKLAAIAGAAMVFIFTLKFIFKLKNHKPQDRIKLPKSDYPELWEFVYQICKETGAPKPKAIYADPNVNAYVHYTNMWLSLFLPVRKELTIGMGLVSCLNMSEFKAVIAHEFGHFAQRSMKIGSYIHSANTIIHDMIYSRDAWDRTLEQWRQSDIRLAVVAWAITPVVWGIRQLLGLFYSLLNIMHSSLSREMEFNADKYAVRAAGSEAIVSALWKLDDGATTWNQTLNHAYVASQKDLFVENVYAHNQLAMKRITSEQQVRLQALPTDERGGTRFFTSSENAKVGMYASHPPNDLRENSAKTPFVPCELDERSPWELFGTASTLQQSMTNFLYEMMGKKPEAFVEEEEFEAFIQTESQGKELFERYANNFVERFTSLPTEEEMHQVSIGSEPPLLEQIEAHRLEAAELMAPVKECDIQIQKAVAIAEGTTKEKEVDVLGETYPKKMIQEAYNTLIRHREHLLNDTFKEWDVRFAALHLELSRQLHRDQELKNLYAQHRKIATFYQRVIQMRGWLYGIIQELQEAEEVTEARLAQTSQEIRGEIAKLSAEFDKLGVDHFVPFGNVHTPEELRKAVLSHGHFQLETSNIFDNDGFGRIVQQVETAGTHLLRVEQRSLAAILLLHEELKAEMMAVA